MGYGAESPMMNDEPEYFDRFEAENEETCPFRHAGAKMLVLRRCCWMDPKATAERIPGDWVTVDVALYHG